MSKEAVLSLIQEAQTNQELLQQLEAATGTTRVLEIDLQKTMSSTKKNCLLSCKNSN